MRQHTPMMQQYYDLKARYKDCILLFRLGDFYEMFDDDAEVVAPLLGLTLTARDGSAKDRIPMCGVPHHAADGYITQLVQHGFKVAICEQIEDPRQAKGLVARDVVKVVTPGTVADDNDMSARDNRFLAAVCGGANHVGIAVCDYSTGEFIATDISGPNTRQQLLDELARLRPPELLLAPELAGWGIAAEIETHFPAALIHIYNADAFDEQSAAELLRHFGAESFAGFGLADSPRAVRAAAAVFRYLQETQKGSLSHITGLATYAPDKQMLLDAATRRNLELTRSLRDGGKIGSLLGVIDRCATTLGGRLLRQWLDRPETEVDVIEHRLNMVTAFYDDTVLREQTRTLLKQVYDIERLAGRAATGSANGRDLSALRASLQQLPQLTALLQQSGHPQLAQLAHTVDVCADVHDVLTAALVDEPPITVVEGDLIRDGYDPHVDRLRDAQRNGKQWIINLETTERERTGIKSLKVGFNRVFGYYIEVTRANLSLVPDNYERKQTLANAERYITPELKQTEADILEAEQSLASLEYELFVALRQKIAGETERLQQLAHRIAEIDVWASLAHVAVERAYVRPRVDAKDRIRITAGRHPVVEVGREADYVPNDVLLDDDVRLVILTGPNMAGKSTYLRQTALIVLMAQIGSYVPAEAADIGVVDRIFTRVGASDDLATGQSTFMVEMTEAGTICNNATSRSLIIIDELGRGTSTYDGIALAQAIAEHLHNDIGAKTIMSTHYHELTQLESTLPHSRNLRVDVTEDRGRVIFLYEVVAGGADRSYGVNVARMAGLPKSVLSRAGRLLQQFEKQRADRHVDQLSFTDMFIAAQETAAAGGMTKEEEAVLEQLLALQLDHLTPLQALSVLSQWQHTLRKEDDVS